MPHIHFRWRLLVPFSILLLYAPTGHTDTPSGSPAETAPLFKAAQDAYYPAKARRLGLTGRVGLEYSIDAAGHAQNIVVADSAGDLLDEHAKALLSDGHFDVASDWSSAGGPSRRYKLGVIFELMGKPKVTPFPDGRPTVVITGR